jgi:hypothetical protein
MERLSKILPGALAKRGLLAESDASLIVHHAKIWIAEKLPGSAAMLFVRSFRDGELLIEAENSIALQECAAKELPLLTHLRETKGHTKVASVRLQRA